MVSLFKKRNWTKWENIYLESSLNNNNTFLVQKREDLNTGDIKIRRILLGKIWDWEKEKLREIKDKFGL